MSMNPGQAFFFFNPGATFTLTFVGQVPQGTLTVTMAPGFNLVGSVVPQAGTLDAALNLTNLPAGDIVYTYDPINGYSTDVATDNNNTPGWSTTFAPTFNVGQGFFFLNTGASPVVWTRTFNIN
jgi:hypothetical protein